MAMGDAVLGEQKKGIGEEKDAWSRRRFIGNA
ncbi:hypothetical protein CCACVL1_21886 [Corchorus capsularis]|uniref:Uncharacterized protein n=1 Tax=Corchorus capsularis TaxID=210143 RepID=A0A1R3H1R5_COCAP|nr:hypothetical protein CCACVL1_21886 [Corchorus capsularis]